MASVDELAQVPVTNPNSPSCDIRLINLTISSLTFDEEGPVHIIFADPTDDPEAPHAKGFMTVEGREGLVKVDPVTLFTIDIPLDSSKDKEAFQEDVKPLRDQLTAWHKAGTKLRLYSEPDHWTYLRGDDGRDLILPRARP